ncbi:hypothetical protein B0A55_00952 [Friedmanniomyces simplex]|uniref:Uncharacterized protein n=1 Tax=Friedmanniomyces simplex TaxID=329884 RepID=A0A4U0XYJ0_9PEZI|nr:hypothetical protein B0A55_00952 [Friedmanniomyces simplex]
MEHTAMHSATEEDVILIAADTTFVDFRRMVKRTGLPDWGSSVTRRNWKLVKRYIVAQGDAFGVDQVSEGFFLEAQMMPMRLGEIDEIDIATDSDGFNAWNSDMTLKDTLAGLRAPERLLDINEDSIAEQKRWVRKLGRFSWLPESQLVEGDCGADDISSDDLTDRLVPLYNHLPPRTVISNAAPWQTRTLDSYNPRWNKQPKHAKDCPHPPVWQVSSAFLSGSVQCVHCQRERMRRFDHWKGHLRVTVQEDYELCQDEEAARVEREARAKEDFVAKNEVEESQPGKNSEGEL